MKQNFPQPKAGAERRKGRLLGKKQSVHEKGGTINRVGHYLVCTGKETQNPPARH